MLEDTIQRQFAARLDENLAGRRLLDRPSPGIEPEPSTIAQLSGMARLEVARRQLRERQPVLADAVDVLAERYVGDLVTRAGSAAARVADWPDGHRALAVLVDLVEAAGVPA